MVHVRHVWRAAVLLEAGTSCPVQRKHWSGGLLVLLERRTVGLAGAQDLVAAICLHEITSAGNFGLSRFDGPLEQGH